MGKKRTPSNRGFHLYIWKQAHRRKGITDLVKPALFFYLCLLLCACASQDAEPNDENKSASAPISFRGTTVLRMNRLLVSIPASARPSGLIGCIAQAEVAGKSEDYGFALDGIVWDVRIFCDQEDLHEIFAPITVCIQPEDGEVSGKAVYQRLRGTFAAIEPTEREAGFVCGLAESLSLFTLWFED